jgi:nickel/cobalt exporter
MSVGAALSMGFVLGLRHAADADHVAAVATLVRGDAGFVKAARVGGLWGLGHAVVLVSVGAVLAGAGWRVPARLATVAELGVCVMLVGLGVAGSLRAAREDRDASMESSSPARGGVGAIGVGAVHGLAGSGGAALLAASVAGPSRALLFLLLFGAGTIVGMSATTVAMSAALRRASSRSSRVRRSLLAAASAASVVLGIALGARLLRGL